MYDGSGAKLQKAAHTRLQSLYPTPPLIYRASLAMASDAVVSSVLTREEKDRIGFENAIVISSDDDDDAANHSAYSLNGASSSSDAPSAKRVKLENGGTAPLQAAAG